MRGREAEARALLARLADADIDSEVVNAELSNIKEALAAQSSLGGFKLRELLTNGPSQNLRRTLLGIAAQFFQQICGINLIVRLRYQPNRMKLCRVLIDGYRHTMQPSFSRIPSVSAPICHAYSPSAI